MGVSRTLCFAFKLFVLTIKLVPLDFFALLKAAGNSQTRFARTVKFFLASFPAPTNANGKQ